MESAKLSRFKYDIFQEVTKLYSDSSLRGIPVEVESDWLTTAQAIQIIGCSRGELQMIYEGKCEPRATLQRRKRADGKGFEYNPVQVDYIAAMKRQKQLVIIKDNKAA